MDQHDVERLRAAVKGSALQPGDDGYDQARRVWNGMIDRSPGLIVRCADPSDVQRSVAFAREHDLLLAVKGGGHSFPGHSVCDGGLMIDLSGLRSVVIDPAAQAAAVDPGVLWSELDAAADAYGLAVTGGQISHTGVAGLALGGGFGWLARRFGLTSDNLLAAEVVTADGELRRASEREHPDLFWALRGGGGNFGIVTSFRFRLHPLGTVYGGEIAHAWPLAGAAARCLRDVAATAPDELSLTGAFLTTPDGHPAFAVAVCCSGPVDDAERIVAPLARFGPPVMTRLGPMSYPAVQTLLDEGTAPGFRYHMRSNLLDELSDEIIDTLAARYAQTPSSRSLIALPQLGGAVSRLPADASAYRHRQAAFVCTVVSAWSDPADDSANVAWARRTGDEVARLTSGTVYVNELGDEGRDRVRAAYGAETYQRLADLKRRYDPTNLFRLNQNITPAA